MTQVDMDILWYMTLVLLEMFTVTKSEAESVYFHSPTSRFKNTKLVSVFSTKLVERKHECFFLCAETPECLSVSLSLYPTGGSHECLLSDVTADQDPSSLIAQTYWRYYEKVTRKIYSRNI